MGSRRGCEQGYRDRSYLILVGTRVLFSVRENGYWLSGQQATSSGGV
jgi:hypothetical protein